MGKDTGQNEGKAWWNERLSPWFSGLKCLHSHGKGETLILGCRFPQMGSHHFTVDWPNLHHTCATFKSRYNIYSGLDLLWETVSSWCCSESPGGRSCSCLALISVQTRGHELCTAPGWSHRQPPFYRIFWELLHRNVILSQRPQHLHKMHHLQEGHRQGQRQRLQTSPISKNAIPLRSKHQTKLHWSTTKVPSQK